MELGSLMDIVFLIIGIGVLGLHIFSLPANWLLLGIIAAWKGLSADMTLSWTLFFGLVGLSLLAEGLEFIIQLKGSQKYGASGKGNFGGILGAILGAIFGAGFLLGIGALPGAILGAYGGCLVVEMLCGRQFDEARSAAWGAMWGKFFGLSAKAGIGGLILGITLNYM